MYVLLGLFSIFISPQIFLYYKYKNFSNSLRIIYGLIISFTVVWIVFNISFYLNLPDILIRAIAIIIMVSSFAYMFYSRGDENNRSYVYLWIIAVILMLPLLNKIGVGFCSLDSASSWNRWAIELYHNIYKPIDAAYPVLMPSLWSVIYKIQGNNDIWWTAQITLFLLPLFLMAILLNLYLETKNKTYIWIAIIAYPYFMSPQTINGDMDMPVMLFGLLSLVSLYAAENHKGKKEYELYVYASLFVSGIASIVKQSGIAFIAFDIVYIALNIKYFEDKKKLYSIVLLSFLYFASFLILYFSYNYAGVAGNIKHLENLSHRGIGSDPIDYIIKLLRIYFMVPPILPVFAHYFSFFGIKGITPVLIPIGYILFAYRGLRKYSSVSFLSAVFFALGFLVWAKYFSYDFRNSLWIRAFFILFLSVNLSYFFNKWYPKPIYVKLFIALAAAFALAHAVKLKDNFTYDLQKKGQINVCLKPDLAKYAASLLNNKKTCCKIYTNELALPYNYYVKEYQKRGQFQAMGRDYRFQDFKYLEHNCSEGSYIIFRPPSKVMGEWWKVEKLEKNKYIKKVKPFVYFVPPGVEIPRDYFCKCQANNKKVNNATK